MPRRLLHFLVVLAALVLLAAGCSRGRGGDGDGAGGTTAPPVVRLEIAGVEPNGTRPPDDATITGVRTALDRWVADAVVAPLFTGRAARDLSAVFAQPALQRLADPAARATLVAEGMPAATKSITAETATTTLSSVAGPDGVVALVAARVDLKLHAVGPSVDVDVGHYGDLVLAPDAGAWKIESFSMHTTRDSRDEG